MRYLIVSDIHANWEALEAVVAAASGLHDRILCCGDLVGYGADPNRVTEWVREHAARVVRGNHDKACAGLDDLEWFNPVAKRSALWTMKELSAENLTYLAELAMGPAEVDGFQILHGSPLDEDEYLLSEQDAVQIFPYVGAALSFFGHTHVQGGFAARGGWVRRIPGVEEEVAELGLAADAAYLINPGSVGQPRDGDRRAGFAIYDSEGAVVRYYRVEYDLAGAQAKIRKAGLPDVLAQRLEVGN